MLELERYTQSAKEVVTLAGKEARGLNHNYLGTEHLLLGLLRGEDDIASRTLAELGVTLEDVRSQVAQIVGQGDGVVAGQIPCTPRAKRVLELALREALSLGHNYIGPEHVLLGIVRESEGVAYRILLGLDADADTVRTGVIRVMMDKPAREAPKSPLKIEVPHALAERYLSRVKEIRRSFPLRENDPLDELAKLIQPHLD